MIPLLLALMAAQDPRPEVPIQEIDMRIHSRPVVSPVAPEAPPPQETMPTPLPNPGVQSEPGLVDFDWMEMDARLGVSVFSPVYHIDPSLRVGLEVRAPLTLLTPADNPEGDYLGLFAQLDVTSIKRTIEPAVDKPSGAMISFSMGVDYSIIRDTTWMLLARVGFQYATYGGVTDLNDGVAPVFALRLGLKLSRALTVTLSPEYVQGDSDSITSGMLGLTFDF